MAAGITLAAIPVFAAGHFSYINSILRVRRAHGHGGGPLLLVPWAVWIAVAVAVWYATAFVGTGPAAGKPVLVGAGLVYSLFLASTAGAASALVLATRQYLPLAFGAALFVASDAVIAARMFRPELLAGVSPALLPALVWLTYGPAQALLVTSGVRAVRKVKNQET
jgi:hypothetical protein